MFASWGVRKWQYPLGVVFWLLALGTANAFAGDLTSIESEYVRTDFTIEDGLPDNTVNAIIQTDNGLLWVGTESGLASFDGRIFTPVRLRIPGAAPPGAVSSLVTGPDGDLWVGSDAGIVRIPKSDLNDPYLATSTAYRVGPEQSDEIEALFKASDGVIWAGTNHGLYRFDGDRFIAVISSAYVSRIGQATDGRLMLITGSGPVEYDGHKATNHPGLGARLGVRDNEIFDVFEDSRGTIWYGTNKGLRAVGNRAPSHLVPYQQAHTATFRISADSHGIVWVSTGVGLYRISGEQLETPAPGLNAHAFYAGEDGDLWIGTNGEGLAHLQRRLVRVYTKADGLANDIAMAVLRANDGRLWVGNNCGLAVFDGVQFKTLNEKDGLANSCVWALAEDHEHNIWIGTYGGGLFRYNGSFQQFTMEQGLPSRIVFQVTVARDDSLWIATPDGLSLMKSGKIHNYTTADGLSSNRILDIHEDRAGAIWVATQGGIDRFTANGFVRVPTTPTTDDILARRFVEDSAGNLYTTNAPRGISRLNGKEVVLFDNKLRLMDMVESPDHNLWFSSREGVIRISEQALAQAANSEMPLSYEQIDRADGLLTTEASVGSPNIAIAPDGKLWVGTVKGVAMIDTAKLPSSGRKPKVFVSDILTDGKRGRVRNELVLSPGPHHVELQLAAVDLANAQKIRLQYRLEGVDSSWLDVNSSRTAVYTNIPPGTHDLKLRATDSQGAWEKERVVYEVTEEPFFYQTGLFQLSVLGGFVLLVVVVYVARVRHLVRQTRAMLEERQVERESVARDLHDTFLQGIQGLILRFHTGAQQLSADQPVRQLFEEALRQSDAVMLEGRSVLSRLRTRRTAPQSLSNAFSAMGQEFRPLSAAQFELVVSGRRRDLSTVVQEELQKIGREALFNSFRHAKATKIEVELHFGIFEFRLRFRDNGVGVDPAILREGSVPGHYGLPGMKERVRQIGGHMDLWSRSGAGTEIEVRIPSAIAYRDSDSGYRQPWLRKLLRARLS
jgi:ligand-binding sensor domain-containing protein/signal transduction histidine kinase